MIIIRLSSTYHTFKMRLKSLRVDKKDLLIFETLF